MQCSLGLLVSDFYAHGLVGGVGEQSTFAGVDGIEQAFACKLAALEDGEATGIEGEFGFVFEPDGAERARFVAAPQSNVFGWEFLLEDGHHG